MSKLTQREAVYQAVSSIKEFNDGETVVLTTEERRSVADVVTTMLVNGEAEFSTTAQAKYDTSDLIRKKYVPGLISNWLRKDTRMNGGEKYQAKNPGSRAGQGDAKLKAMRGLLKQFQAANAPSEKVTAIEEAIATRVSELAQAKAKHVKIDTSVLSPELLDQLGLDTEVNEEA